MFGKTLVFLAKVEHRTGNTLALRCGARAVYNRLYNYEEFNRKAETEDTPECIAADGAAQLFNWRPEGPSERAGGKGARGVSPCSSRTILCRNRTCHYIHQLSERIKNWRESRQAAYKNREISFKSWNFLEFTLAAAEGGHRGLLRPVDGKTLIPRLTGGLLALLGLLKP
ncbi:hypothetical protein L208DRAFT_1382870 [Tricholoma matsutake]|nr:hypothetical protein L208DRAFT_1382870 [Tricholoma matsutake 945]